MKKELKLVSQHSCWWKKKKYIRDSAQTLKRFKYKGWKLISVRSIEKNINAIDTKSYKIYCLRK